MLLSAGVVQIPVKSIVIASLDSLSHLNGQLSLELSVLYTVMMFFGVYLKGESDTFLLL